MLNVGFSRMGCSCALSFSFPTELPPVRPEPFSFAQESLVEGLDDSTAPSEPALRLPVLRQAQHERV
jgi:hypothetical protein